MHKKAQNINSELFKSVCYNLQFTIVWLDKLLLPPIC